jgi:hypothetical protein
MATSDVSLKYFNMKYLQALTLFFVSGLFLVACDKTKPETENCAALSTSPPRHLDGVIALEPTMEDKCLALAVTYGGGCAEHDFELYWDGQQSVSLPGQITLQLGHDNNRDDCKALRYETLSFDLSEALSGSAIDVIIQAPAIEDVTVRWEE